MKRTRTNARAKRKRGGQAGNLNALKHGFYSRHFAADESADLSAVIDSNLDSEIAMVRVVTRRALAILAVSRSGPKQERLIALLGEMAIRIASLLKNKQYLAGEGGTFDKLDQVLRDMADGFKVDNV